MKGTFVCRLEMVNIRSLHSQAKILGTIVAVGGALFMINLLVMHKSKIS